MIFPSATPSSAVQGASELPRRESKRPARTDTATSPSKRGRKVKTKIKEARGWDEGVNQCLRADVRVVQAGVMAGGAAQPVAATDSGVSFASLRAALAPAEPIARRHATPRPPCPPRQLVQFSD